MSTPDALQRRAVEQRDQIHRTSSDLITSIKMIRHDLSVTGQVTRHLGPIAVIFSALAFTAGFQATAGLRRTKRW
jgi:hypothetical protein